jgi:hypothetical protein
VRPVIAIELSSNSTGIWKFHDLLEQNDLPLTKSNFAPEGVGKKPSKSHTAGRIFYPFR